MGPNEVTLKNLVDLPTDSLSICFKILLMTICLFAFCPVLAVFGSPRTHFFLVATMKKCPGIGPFLLPKPKNQK